jgi:protein-S-isoprenylcysteine O-methyltransferase Ste14
MPLSRFFAAVIACLVLFTAHGWEQGVAMDIGFEIAGFVLLVLCAAGRVWSLLYISGRKTSSLVDEGPYSVVRHPLYVSTFLGSLGVGFASENLIAMAAILLFTLISYWPVVRSEESRLLEVHGDRYRAYQARVPQLIPRLSLLREPDELLVRPRFFRRGAAEAIAIIGLYMALQMIEGLHAEGVLPVLFRIG